MIHHSKHSHAKCIRSVPIFNHLEDQQMDKIAESAKTLELQKGEMLFRAGERDDTLYIVSQGKIQIYRLADSGKEQLIRILNPGDFIGEWTLFHPGEVHENYAVTIQKTSICLIKQTDLQAHLLQHPTIALKIIEEMSSRLEGSERQTMQVAIEKVETRIIAYLVDCVENDEENGPTITLPMSKKDLASYLGTTPETISRKFTELEHKGLIEQLPKRHIRIPDLDKLLQYAK
ncbi:Crp/Fnr family transcriptional regulator [Terrilactibacillus laevilacticus]|uniref:Crp/Fnr family transcriptional regulator n=1 Tax=Terrilactibacillus laevilacticus TaxID=1380157 RepID=A0ABW5PUY7_9BACI|nr:Crp/Fnr family transcriptional regulator [Terrilactibacillus laevilacticus]